MSRTITFQAAGTHSRGTVSTFSGEKQVGAGVAHAMYTRGWAAVGSDAIVEEERQDTACSGGSLPCPCGVTL